MEHHVVDALISPEGRLDILSKSEVARLLDTSQGGLYNVFRSCSLAVLNCGSPLDDGKELLERYKSFPSASSSANAASSSTSRVRRRMLSSTAK